MNLYRYVQNEPTNETDPSGLVVYIVNRGQPVPKAKFGGGVVTFPDGCKGSIRVWVDATLARMYASTSAQIATNTLSTLAGLGGPLTSASLIPPFLRPPEGTVSHGIIIEYTGPHAQDVNFVQTVWHTIYYKVEGKRAQYWDDSVEGPEGKIIFSEPDRPVYALDIVRAQKKSPVYSTVEQTGDSLTLFDRPAPEWALAAFLTQEKKYDPKFEEKLVSADSTFHFDTVLAYRGSPLYKVSWDVSDNYEDKHYLKEYPVYDVTGGGPNQGFSPQQLKVINDRTPGQKIILK
jgi:hypothetical protein